MHLMLHRLNEAIRQKFAGYVARHRFLHARVGHAKSLEFLQKRHVIETVPRGGRLSAPAWRRIRHTHEQGLPELALSDSSNEQLPADARSIQIPSIPGTEEPPGDLPILGYEGIVPPAESTMPNNPAPLPQSSEDGVDHLQEPSGSTHTTAKVWRRTRTRGAGRTVPGAPAANSSRIPGSTSPEPRISIPDAAEPAAAQVPPGVPRRSRLSPPRVPIEPAAVLEFNEPHRKAESLTTSTDQGGLSPAGPGESLGMSSPMLMGDTDGYRAEGRDREATPLSSTTVNDADVTAEIVSAAPEHPIPGPSARKDEEAQFEIGDPGRHDSRRSDETRAIPAVPDAALGLRTPRGD